MITPLLSLVYLYLCFAFWRPDFHNCFFSWIVKTFPGFPVDSIGKRVMSISVIQSIQVWIVTSFIPPSTLKHLGTVCFWILVIVSVLGTEGHAIMITQRIACICNKYWFIYKSLRILSVIDWFSDWSMHSHGRLTEPMSVDIVKMGYSSRSSLSIMLWNVSHCRN